MTPERLRELADELEVANVEELHGYSAVLLGQKLGEAMEALRAYADLRRERNEHNCPRAVAGAMRQFLQPDVRPQQVWDAIRAALGEQP